MSKDTVPMSQENGSIVKRYGIADALSELMESAVLADTNAAQKAYDMIRMHAYGLTPISASGSNNVATRSSGYSTNMSSQTQKVVNSLNQHNVSMNQDAEMSDKIALDNYEKENEGRLAMAQFSMRDSSGSMKEVSIPKITMMPLPLLHVTEATFDLDLSVNLVDTSDNISIEEMEMANAVLNYYYSRYRATTIDQAINLIRNMIQQGQMGYKMSIPASTSTTYLSSGQWMSNQWSSSQWRGMGNQSSSQWRGMSSQSSSQWSGNNGYYYLTLREQLDLLNKYKSSANSQIGPGSAFKVSQQGSDNDKSTTNLKVNIKMKQAELPDGIKLLLQAAANSLQVAAKEINESE